MFLVDSCNVFGENCFLLQYLSTKLHDVMFQDTQLFGLPVVTNTDFFILFTR